MSANTFHKVYEINKYLQNVIYKRWIKNENENQICQISSYVAIINTFSQTLIPVTVEWLIYD